MVAREDKAAIENPNTYLQVCMVLVPLCYHQTYINEDVLTF